MGVANLSVRLHSKQPSPITEWKYTPGKSLYAVKMADNWIVIKGHRHRIGWRLDIYWPNTYQFFFWGGGYLMMLSVTEAKSFELGPLDDNE